MAKLTILSGAIVCWFIAISFYNPFSNLPIESKGRIQYELPEIHMGDQIVTHIAYTLNYAEEYEEAAWTAYMLTKKMTVPKYPRTNSFKVDPDVTTGSAEPADYKKPYDRGHLVPCDNMRWSKQAESESFFMSNMTPQVHSFNAGIWKKLEGWVTKCAKLYDTVYVASGPVLAKGLKQIGKKNKISVPDYFYKVIIVYTEKVKKGIGFILQHKQSTKPLLEFAIPIDSVEKITKINFFSNLPTKEGKVIESSVDINSWPKK
jgi:endonuclease G, mitochondrial